MLSDAQIAEGRALARALNDPTALAAIQGIVLRLKSGLFEQYQADKSLTREWLDGASRVIEDFEAAVMQIPEDARAAIEEKETARKVVERAGGDDGFAIG